MSQVMLSTRQREAYRNFTRQYPDEKLGVISLQQKYGYFYLVPMSDRFYTSQQFGIRELNPELSVIDLGDRDTHIFSNLRPTWVDALTECLAPDHRAGSVLFLDIGGFVGSVSLHLLSDANSKDWRIHAFEPNPFNFDLLKLNLLLNDFPDVAVENIACSNSTGEAQFWARKGGRISGRLATTQSGDTFTVKSSTISNYIESNDLAIDKLILKIDTEGFEKQVLQGASEDLLRKTLCAIVEYWPSKDLSYENYLFDRFSAYAINSTMFSAPPPYRLLGSPEELQEWGAEYISKHNNVDILLLPKTADDPASMRLRRLISR